MAEIKIEIPADTEIELKRHSNIVLSRLLQRALRGELKKMAERRAINTALNKLLENSDMTEVDALELGEKTNSELHKKYKREGMILLMRKISNYFLLRTSLI